MCMCMCAKQSQSVYVDRKKLNLPPENNYRPSFVCLSCLRIRSGASRVFCLRFRASPDQVGREFRNRNKRDATIKLKVVTFGRATVEAPEYNCAKAFTKNKKNPDTASSIKALAEEICYG